MNCCAQQNYESNPPRGKCCNVERYNLDFLQKKFEPSPNAKIKGRIGSFGNSVSSWCNPANGPGVEGAYSER